MIHSRDKHILWNLDITNPFIIRPNSVENPGYKRTLISRNLIMVASAIRYVSVKSKVQHPPRAFDTFGFPGEGNLIIEVFPPPGVGNLILAQREWGIWTRT